MSVKNDGVRRRLKGPQRRELVLAAARDLFSANGYDAVSMRDIATAAGITRPVLYDHFTSKKDLILELLTEETEALIARIADQVTTDAPATKRLSAALRAYFDFMIERPLASRLLLTPAMDPEVAEVSTHLRDLAHLGVVALIAPEMPDADPHQPDIAATILVASVISVANWWLDHPDVSPDVLVETTMSLISPGLTRLSSPHI